MGKGSRSRALRAEEKINHPEKYKKKQHKPVPKWIAPLVALIVVVAIVVGVVFSILNVNGVMRRAKISVSSENFEVTGTMMSVYYNSIIQSYNNNAYQYAYYYYMVYGQSSGKSFAEYYQQMLGYTPGKDLDKQTMSKDSDRTWFDYFLSSAKSSVTSMLVYCEAAKAAGFELTDEDRKTIDEEVASLKESAAKSEMSFSSYLSQNFGTGVKESDFRAAYELQLLANKYQEKVFDDLDHSITEDDINKYYDEHKIDFSVIRYIAYTASTKGLDKDKIEELKNAATALEDATTYEEFKEKFTDFFRIENGDFESEEEFQNDLEKAIKDNTQNLTYADRDEKDNYENWMFSGEWKGDTEKNPGDVTVGKTIVVEGKDTYTIYHLLTVPEKNTFLVDQDVSYIPIKNFTDGFKPADLEVFANQVLADFEAGEHTADAMKSLAETLNKGIAEEANQLKYTNIEKYSSSSKMAENCTPSSRPLASRPPRCLIR